MVENSAKGRQFHRLPLLNATEPFFRHCCIGEKSTKSRRIISTKSISHSENFRAIRKPGADEIATTLEAQIQKMMTKFQELQQAGLKDDFVRRFNAKQNELAPVWEEKWRELCNGKQLLEDLRRDGHVKGDLLKLKQAVIAEMRKRKTETYNSLDNMLRTLIGLRE